MKFVLVLLVLITTGCASTKESADSTAEVKKKESCTSVKVMGSKMKKRICKS